MLENADDASARGPIFFYLVVEKKWLRGAAGPIVFSLQFLTFCLAYYQPYEAMTGPKSSELLTYLVVWHARRVLSYLLT